MTTSLPAALEVRDAVKHFSGRGRRPAPVRAVDGVSFAVAPGEMYAVVGESGCGKSTLANMALGLLAPTSGELLVEGTPVASRSRRALRDMRRAVQMIFQDPYEALNPLMTIEEIVGEPLAVHHIGRRGADRRERVCQALRAAGLSPAEQYLPRRPHELSGGQRQRVVIAGAMVLEPRVLVADEPVSMLDVSIRAEILNLLKELSRTRALGVVLITHDLSLLPGYADRVGVMYLGRIVEEGTVDEVLASPAHPYTKALLSVVPTAHPVPGRRRIILSGETPDAARMPPGCRFHPRCPEVVELCPAVDPADVALSPTHRAACLLLLGAGPRPDAH